MSTNPASHNNRVFLELHKISIKLGLLSLELLLGRISPPFQATFKPREMTDHDMDKIVRNEGPGASPERPRKIPQLAPKTTLGARLGNLVARLGPPYCNDSPSDRLG